MTLAKSILTDVINMLRFPISIEIAAMNVVNSYRLQGKINSKNIKELIHIFLCNKKGPVENAIIDRLQDCAELICDLTA